jgi:hypothetical protein
MLPPALALTGAITRLDDRNKWLAAASRFSRGWLYTLCTAW